MWKSRSISLPAFLAAIAASAVTIPATLAASAGDGAGPPEAGLSIHLVPATEIDCPALDSLRCGEIHTRGWPAVDQLAYIVLSGFTEAREVRFGINYDEAVDVRAWLPCLLADELKRGRWPGRGTGIRLAWRACMKPLGPDGLLVLGALRIGAGSWGRIWLERYGKKDPAELRGCAAGSRPILLPPERLGMARVDGSHPGRTACGSTRE
jgi:hypothetical protein